LSAITDVLCDAGPLIAISKLNRLEILAELYDKILVPRPVYDEVVTSGLAIGASDAKSVRLFLQNQKWPIVDISSDTLNSYTPSVIIGAGEIAVLALARTLRCPLVLIDDEVARGEARRLGLAVRGTLGVLIQACRQKILTTSQTEFLINEISIRRDIWISGKLCEQVLKELRKTDGFKVNAS